MIILSFASMAIISGFIFGIAYLARLINLPARFNALAYITLTNIVAFLLIPLRSVFDRISAKIFYRNTYNPQELTKQASNTLSSSIDLDKISHSILGLLSDSFKLDHIGLLVLNTPGSSTNSPITSSNYSSSTNYASKVAMSLTINPRTKAHSTNQVRHSSSATKIKARTSAHGSSSAKIKDDTSARTHIPLIKDSTLDSHTSTKTNSRISNQAYSASANSQDHTSTSTASKRTHSSSLHSKTIQHTEHSTSTATHTKASPITKANPTTKTNTSTSPKVDHLSVYRSYYYPLDSSLTIPSKVLISYLNTNMVVVDELPETATKYELTSRNIGLIINLRNSFNQPLAILILGYKKSGDIYTNSDLTALKLITNELSLALYNAQNLSELKDFNLNLQSKVDDATKALRRSNKRLLDLDKAKDEFLSIASHQLRTPVTTIKGYLSMILEGDYGHIPNTQSPIIKQLSSISDQMSSLISDILNVSRISQNKFILTTTSTDLKDLITKQIAKLSHLAAQKNITFSTHLTPTTNLDLDQEKMSQVVSNLIDNAIHYSTPNSTITIKLEKTIKPLDKSYYPSLEPLEHTTAIHHKLSSNHSSNPSHNPNLNPSPSPSLNSTLRHSTNPSPKYRFLVTDTGIGVPRKEQAKLFTKFYRATNATTIRPDGTGLGLFLVRKVIEAHHGNLIFNSKASNASLSSDPSLDIDHNSLDTSSKSTNLDHLFTSTTTFTPTASASTTPNTTTSTSATTATTTPTSTTNTKHTTPHTGSTFGFEV
jgi:signal transduction histidine kinase